MKAGEVAIKIHAAALNPIGWKLMKYLPDWLRRRPYVAEGDFSGVVVDANGSTGLVEGDEVYGWIPSALAHSTKQGALSEYITLPGSFVAKRPSNISAIEAAGVAITALTALQALNDAKLEGGQSIFINGGSTAVGAWAIQLTKARGVSQVVVACSKKNEDYVRGLGADEVIDYTSIGPLHTYLHQNPPSTRFNAVLDAVALFDSSLYTESSQYLQPNGAFISVGPIPQEFSWGVIPQVLKWIAILSLPSMLSGIRQRGKIVALSNNAEDMELIRQYLEEGRIKPTVDSVHAFDNVLQAYERIIPGRVRGKVVVNVSLPQDTVQQYASTL